MQNICSKRKKCGGTSYIYRKTPETGQIEISIWPLSRVWWKLLQFIFNFGNLVKSCNSASVSGVWWYLQFQEFGENSCNLSLILGILWKLLQFIFSFRVWWKLLQFIVSFRSLVKTPAIYLHRPHCSICMKYFIVKYRCKLLTLVSL